MHQSSVTPAPPPTYGDSGANVRGNDLLSSPTVPGKSRACVLRKYTPVKFTLIKSRAMTLSRSPQCRAFMDEKSSSPLFPVGGGAVATNDWCIITCSHCKARQCSSLLVTETFQIGHLFQYTQHTTHFADTLDSWPHFRDSCLRHKSVPHF